MTSVWYSILSSSLIQIYFFRWELLLELLQRTPIVYILFQYKIESRIIFHLHIQVLSSLILLSVAMLTVKIRRLQDKMLVCKKNTQERVSLQETIDRRNKLLRKLRKQDYKRFEWLIEELGVLHRPYPEYDLEFLSFLEISC